MDYEILHKPSYALAQVRLNQGEQLQAEAGAMVSMSDSIRMETSARGGIFGGLRRSVLGGESFFVNTFSAEQPGEVAIAPSLLDFALELLVVDLLQSVEHVRPVHRRLLVHRRQGTVDDGDSRPIRS